MENGYKFLQAGSEPGKRVEAREGVHEGFNRGAVDEGINIMELLLALPGVKANPALAANIAKYDFGKVESSKIAKGIHDEDGNLLPEMMPEEGTTLEIDVPKIKSGAQVQVDVLPPPDDTEQGPKNLETVGERESKLFTFRNGSWRIGKGFHFPEAAHIDALNLAWEQKLDEKFTGATRDANLVTAADLAEYFATMKGSVYSFGDIPSSDVKRGIQTQYPGAPGAGLLLPVWNEFITALYKKLNITEKAATAGKGKVKSQLQNAKTVFVKGERTKNVLKDDTLLVDAMHADLAPIIQAVIDADRVNLYEAASYEKTDVDDGSVVRRNFQKADTEDLNDVSQDGVPEDPGSVDEGLIQGSGTAARDEIKGSKFQKAAREGAKEAAKEQSLSPLETDDLVKEQEAKAARAIDKLRGSEAAKKLRQFRAALQGEARYSHAELLKIFPPTEGIYGGKATGRNPNIWELFDLATLTPIILPDSMSPDVKSTGQLQKKEAALKSQIKTQEALYTTVAEAKHPQITKRINELNRQLAPIQQKLYGQSLIDAADDRRQQGAPAPKLDQVKDFEVQRKAVRTFVEELKSKPLYKAFLELIYHPSELLGSGLPDEDRLTFREMLSKFLFGTVRRTKTSVPEEEVDAGSSRRGFLKTLGLGATTAVTGLPKTAGAAVKTASKGAALSVQDKRWNALWKISNLQMREKKLQSFNRVIDTPRWKAQDNLVRAIADELGIDPPSSDDFKYPPNWSPEDIREWGEGDTGPRYDKLREEFQKHDKKVDMGYYDLEFEGAMAQFEKDMLAKVGLHYSNSKYRYSFSPSSADLSPGIRTKAPYPDGTLGDLVTTFLEETVSQGVDSLEKVRLSAEIEKASLDYNLLSADHVDLNKEQERAARRKFTNLDDLTDTLIEVDAQDAYFEGAEEARRHALENDIGLLEAWRIEDMIFREELEAFDKFLEGSGRRISGKKAMAERPWTPADVKKAYSRISLVNFEQEQSVELKESIKLLRNYVSHLRTSSSKVPGERAKAIDSTQRTVALAQAALAGLNKVLAQGKGAVDSAFSLTEFVEGKLTEFDKAIQALENTETKGEEINIMPEKEKVPVKTKESKDEGLGSLGAGMVLTSSLPDNFANLFGMSRFLANNQGDPDRDGMLARMIKGTAMTNFVDQARPVKHLHDKLLKEMGIPEDSPIWDTLQVHRKWHAYFGKGYYTVERAERKYIEPIKAALRKHKITQERFGEYLLARAAPSRNEHLRLRELDQQKEELASLYNKNRSMENQSQRYKDLKEKHKTAEIPTSGIETHVAEDVVRTMEAEKDFMDFLNDSSQPLQKFYAMNRDALDQKTAAGLIQGSSNPGSLAENERMVAAMSHYDWNKISNIKLNDKYSYAPMQGFAGETDKLQNREEAYERLGKAASTTGKGWDQPKQKFISKGAFGRGSFVKDGVKGSYAPDPAITLATAVEQYFNDSIRSQKNEVSQSFGELFEMMRAVANPKYLEQLRTSNPEYAKLIDEMTDDSKAAIAEDFHKTFETEFKPTEEGKEYKLEAEDVLDENGKAIPRLRTRRRKLNLEFRNDPHVFVYRKDGVPLFVKFKVSQEGSAMADTMKNLRYQALPSVLKPFNTATRFLAKMYTSANPAFIIPNFFRDYGTAFIHLTEDEKRGLVKDALNMGNIAKFARGIHRAERAKARGEDLLAMDLDTTNAKAMAKTAADLLAEGDHAKMYEFAQAAGAKVGYFRHSSMLEQVEQINKDIAKHKGLTRKTATAVGKTIDHMNTAVENSIRMSSFWAAIKRGDSVEKATHIARNVTVDFNQKGNYTQTLGALYVFFGAGMNSIDRMIRSLNSRSPKELSVLFGGIIGSAITVSLFNRMLDPQDDEEEQPDYDTINSYKRDTNLIVPMPSWFFGNEEGYAKKDTGFFSLPLPLGYNALWAIGQVVGDVLARVGMGANAGSSILDGTSRITRAVTNAVNPVNSDSMLTMGVPSAFKPLIELKTNENFMGSPIRYEDSRWNPPQPGHMQDPASTSQHWKDLSKGLNSFFGGSDDTKGTLIGDPSLASAEQSVQFDISGSQFQHLLYNYLGGMGQIGDAGVGLLYNTVIGKKVEFDWGAIPIASRFVRGSTHGVNIRSDFKSLHNLTEAIGDEIEEAEKAGPKSATAIRQKYKEVLPFLKLVKNVEKNKNAIRRQIKKAENNKKLTDFEITQQVDKLEAKQLKSQIHAIRKARELGFEL